MKKTAIYFLTFLFLTSNYLAHATSFYPSMTIDEEESATIVGMPQPPKSDDISSEDIATIYRKQIPCSITFENNLDPYEQQDNYLYSRSPYPLIRTIMPMYSIKTKIPPGYYLLTPRKIDSRTYVLFKQQGKVLYIAPVFAEEQIDMEKEYPKAEDPYDKAPFGLRSIWKGIGIITGRRTPIVKVPLHKLDCFAYDDKYYGINIYYKDKLYKTVFKIQLYE